MLEFKELLQLMKVAAKASTSAPTSYSFNGQNLSGEAINETLREELKELCGTNALYRENKNTIFSLIEQTLDDVLPRKITEDYMQFAEVKVFSQGDKPIFRRKLNSNNRAKQFITRVGLAGVYEVFKLGKGEEAFEVRTSAIGGAAQIGFEEFLDGRVDFAEVTRIVYEGMEELIAKEVAHALKSSINQLPPANRVAVNGFDENEFDRLINVALPRVKDFRGIKATGFDGHGNFSLGITEQIIFPEIDFDKIERVAGMNISIVTSAETDSDARALLTKFGMPFRK